MTKRKEVVLYQYVKTFLQVDTLHFEQQMISVEYFINSGVNTNKNHLGYSF